MWEYGSKRVSPFQAHRLTPKCVQKTDGKSAHTLSFKLYMNVIFIATPIYVIHVIKFEEPRTSIHPYIFWKTNNTKIKPFFSSSALCQLLRNLNMVRSLPWAHQETRVSVPLSVLLRWNSTRGPGTLQPITAAGTYKGIHDKSNEIDG